MLRPFVHHETPWSWWSLLLQPTHRCRRAFIRPQLQLPNSKHRAIGSTRRVSFPDAQAIRIQGSAAFVAVQTGSDRGHRNEPIDSLRSKDSLRAALLAALRSKNPEQLLNIAVEAFRDDELVKSLHPTTIYQIFESLRFQGLLSEHLAIAQVLAPGAIATAQTAGWRIQNISQVIERIRGKFSTLFYDWVESGRGVDLPKCKSYLRFLSSAGQAKEARNLRSLCEKHDIDWDTETYNLFMEAVCWEEWYLPDEFGRLRVTGSNLTNRQTLPHGYSIAVKDEVVGAFEEMVAKGCAADARTFSLIMLSMGRVGALSGVEATLNRIWGVDVSSLSKGDSSAFYFENDMQPDAPLYPDKYLLFVVAHVYGSNNSLPMALRIVDFISEKYSITIDHRTWEELAKWAFILGRPRGGGFTLSAHKASLQRDLSEGKVPEAFFLSLWRTMTSKRFQVTPTLQMFNWLYSMHYGRSEILDMMRLLRYCHQRFGLGNSYAKLIPGGDPPHSRSLPKSISELEKLKALATSSIFLRWFRLALHGNRFEGRNKHVNPRWFYTRFIPTFIAEWGNLWFGNATKTLHYRAFDGGRISFHRQMSDKNQTSMEIFPSAAQDRSTRYIVLAKSPCLSLPFQEVSHGELRQVRFKRGLEAGENLQYEVPNQWYEQPTVGDWIWLAPGKGVRLEGGQFQGETKNQRRLVFPENAFDRLERDQASKVRQRLTSS